VKTAFQSLITWNVQLTTMNPAQLPPPYNQRLFLIAERLLGAPGVLSIVLTEIKEQTENPAGSAAAALDIATALICAPKTENSPIEVTWLTSPVPAQQPHQSKRLNLREALSIEHERATDIIKKDNTLAESIVRLHRLVEAQATISTVPLPDLTSTMPAPDMQQMLDSMAATTQQNTADVLQSRRPTLDLTADSAGLPELAMSGADPMQMDFSGAGDDGMGGLLGGGGSMNPDDDVFGDLDFSNMDGMDTMDTEYGF
jgi:mediator of RNA polymerase II transcription subunit 5